MGLYKPGFVRQNVTNCSPQLMWGLLLAQIFLPLIPATALQHARSHRKDGGIQSHTLCSWFPMVSTNPALLSQSQSLPSLSHSPVQPSPAIQWNVLGASPGLCSHAYSTSNLIFSLWRAWLLTWAVKIRRLFLLSLLAGLAQASCVQQEKQW